MQRYDDKKAAEISKNFPNVLDDEFQFEAKRRLEYALGIWLTKVDWSKPTIEEVEQLRDECQGKMLDYISDQMENPNRDDELEAFTNSEDKITQEYVDANIDLIRDIGRTLANSPLLGDDFLAVDKGYTVTATMAFGGPYSSVTFHLDKDGELQRAQAHYGWGFKSAKLDIPSDIAEKLWNNFSYMSEEIACQSNQGFGPR